MTNWEGDLGQLTSCRLDAACIWICDPHVGSEPILAASREFENWGTDRAAFESAGTKSVQKQLADGWFRMGEDHFDRFDYKDITYKVTKHKNYRTCEVGSGQGTDGSVVLLIRSWQKTPWVTYIAYASQADSDEIWEIFHEYWGRSSFEGF